MRLSAIPLCIWLTCSPSAVWADDRQYELIIHACLQMNPTNCSQYVQPVQSLPSNPSAAYAQAQAMVAKFMEAHPGLVLRGFDMLPDRGA